MPILVLTGDKSEPFFHAAAAALAEQLPQAAHHCSEVARLLHDFNTEFDTPSPGVDVLAERLGRLLAGSSMFAIVAGSPAIALAVVTDRPNVWYDGDVAMLDELYVAPGHRNYGVGTAILALLNEHARAVGIDAVEIGVDGADVDAQRFYERHGYSSVEPDTNERIFYYFREVRRADLTIRT